MKLTFSYPSPYTEKNDVMVRPRASLKRGIESIHMLQIHSLPLRHKQLDCIHHKF